MANFYGSGRSNYVSIKPKMREKFIELCGDFELRFIEREDKVGFFSDTEDGGFGGYFEDEDGITTSRDALHEFSELLEKGEVLIFITVGSEKMRYICGYALAINSKGEMVDVSLDDIYKKAKSLGKNITTAEY